MADTFVKGGGDFYPPLPVKKFTHDQAEFYSLKHAGPGNENRNLARDLIGRLAFSKKYKRHFAIGDNEPKTLNEAYQNVKRGQANFLTQDLSIFGRIEPGESVADESIIRHLSNVQKPSYLETFSRSTGRMGASFGGFLTGAAAGHNAAALTGPGYPYTVLPFSLIGGVAGTVATDKIASDGINYFFGEQAPVLPSARATNESMKTLGTAPWFIAPHLATGKSFQLVGSNIVENATKKLKESLSLKDYDTYAKIVKKYGFKTQPTKTLTGNPQIFPGPVYDKKGNHIITPAKDYGFGPGVVAGDFTMLSDELMVPWIYRNNFLLERFLSNVGQTARGEGTKKFGPTILGTQANVGAAAFAAGDVLSLSASTLAAYGSEKVAPGDVGLRLFNEIAAGVGTEILLVKSLPMLYTQGQKFIDKGAKQTLSSFGEDARRRKGMTKIVKLLKENGEDHNKVLALLEENALTKHFNKQKEIVVPQLEKQVKMLDEQLATAKDPAQASEIRTQITSLRTDIQDLQDFNPTVGMITMSPTLLTIENNLAQIGSKALGVSRASQADKALNGLRRYIQILESTGDKSLIKEAANIRKKHLENLININMNTKLATMAEAVRTVRGPEVSPSVLGETTFTTLNNWNTTMRKMESSLWTDAKAGNVVINKFYNKENDTFNADDLVLNEEGGENIPNFLKVYLKELKDYSEADGSIAFLDKKLGELTLDLKKAMKKFGLDGSEIDEKSVNELIIPSVLANSNAKIASLAPAEEFVKKLKTFYTDNAKMSAIIKEFDLLKEAAADPKALKYTEDELKAAQKEWENVYNQELKKEDFDKHGNPDEWFQKKPLVDKEKDALKRTIQQMGKKPEQVTVLDESNILTGLSNRTAASKNLLFGIDRKITYLKTVKNYPDDAEQIKKLQELKDFIISGKGEKFGPVEKIDQTLLNKFSSSTDENAKLNFIEEVIKNRLSGPNKKYLGSGPGSERQRLLDAINFIKEKRKNITLNNEFRNKQSKVKTDTETDAGYNPQYDAKTLFAIRSLALTKIRELANDPSAFNTRRILGKIANAVLDDLEGFGVVNSQNVELFSNYNSAVAFSKAYNDHTTRTFMGEVLEKNRLGAHKINFEELAEKFNLGNASAVTLRVKQLTDLGTFFDERMKPNMSETDFNKLMGEHKSFHKTMDDLLRITTKKKIIKTKSDKTGKNLTLDDVDVVALEKLKKDWENSGLLDIMPNLKNDFEDTAQLLNNINYMNQKDSAFQKSLKENIAFSRFTNIENPSVALAKAVEGDNPTTDLNAIIKVINDVANDTGASKEELNKALASTVLRYGMIKSGGPIGFKPGPMHKALFEPMTKALPENVTKMLAEMSQKNVSPEIIAKAEAQAYKNLKYGKETDSLMGFMVKNKVISPEESTRVKQLLEKMAQFEGAAQAGMLTDDLLDETGAVLDLTLRISGSFLGTTAQKLFPGGGSQAGSLIAASAGSKFMRRVFERMPNVASLDVMSTVMRNPDLFRALMASPGVSEASIQGHAALIETLLSNAGLLTLKPVVFSIKEIFRPELNLKSEEAVQTNDQVSSLNLPTKNIIPLPPAPQGPPPETISPSLASASPITPIAGPHVNQNQSQRSQLAAAFPFDITSDVTRMRKAGIGSLMG